MDAATTSYSDIASAVEEHGFIARGLFRDETGRSVVIVGNTAADMWDHFEDGRRDEPDPLDAWTRRCLDPIATRFDAEFVHPSDEPFVPFQQWAQRADTVWPSPIGLLIHPRYGLWHAYRGAFVFPVGREVVFDRTSNGPPHDNEATNPCLLCADQPCLSTCPVDAFSSAGYDHIACRNHVAGESSPDCLHEGCAARRACPVGVGLEYGSAQMLFHMRAFSGIER